MDHQQHQSKHSSSSSSQLQQQPSFSTTTPSASSSSASSSTTAPSSANECTNNQNQKMSNNNNNNNNNNVVVELNFESEHIRQSDHSSGSHSDQSNHEPASEPESEDLDSECNSISFSQSAKSTTTTDNGHGGGGGGKRTSSYSSYYNNNTRQTHSKHQHYQRQQQIQQQQLNTPMNTPTNVGGGGGSGKLQQQYQQQQQQQCCSFSDLWQLGSQDEMAAKLAFITQAAPTCFEFRNDGILPVLVQMLHSHSMLNDEEQELLALNTNSSGGGSGGTGDHHLCSYCDTTDCIEFDHRQIKLIEDRLRATMAMRRKASKALRNIICNTSVNNNEIQILGLLEDLRSFVELFYLKFAKLPADVVDHPTTQLNELLLLCCDADASVMCETLGGAYVIADVIQSDYRFHQNGNQNESCHQVRQHSLNLLSKLATISSAPTRSLLANARPLMQLLVKTFTDTNSDRAMLQAAAQCLFALTYKADYSSKQAMREVQIVTCITKRAIIVADSERNDSTLLNSMLQPLMNLTSHCAPNKMELCKVSGALELLFSLLTYCNNNNNNNNTPTDVKNVTDTEKNSDNKQDSGPNSNSTNTSNNNSTTSATNASTTTATTTITAKPTNRIQASVIEHAGGILRNISSYISTQDELLNQHVIGAQSIVLQVLLEQLKSSSLGVVGNAMVTLCNLSARSSVVQQKLIELGALQMMHSLSNSRHECIQMSACRTLKHLLGDKYHTSVYNTGGGGGTMEFFGDKDGDNCPAYQTPFSRTDVNDTYEFPPASIMSNSYPAPNNASIKLRRLKALQAELSSFLGTNYDTLFGAIGEGAIDETVPQGTETNLTPVPHNSPAHGPMPTPVPLPIKSNSFNIFTAANTMLNSGGQNGNHHISTGQYRLDKVHRSNSHDSIGSTHSEPPGGNYGLLSKLAQHSTSFTDQSALRKCSTGGGGGGGTPSTIDNKAASTTAAAIAYLKLSNCKSFANQRMINSYAGQTLNSIYATMPANAERVGMAYGVRSYQQQQPPQSQQSQKQQMLRQLSSQQYSANYSHASSGMLASNSANDITSDFDISYCDPISGSSSSSSGTMNRTVSSGGGGGNAANQTQSLPRVPVSKRTSASSTMTQVQQQQQKQQQKQQQQQPAQSQQQQHHLHHHCHQDDEDLADPGPTDYSQRFKEHLIEDVDHHHPGYGRSQVSKKSTGHVGEDDTVGETSCSDTIRVYQTEGTPVIVSRVPSFTDLRAGPDSHLLPKNAASMMQKSGNKTISPLFNLATKNVVAATRGGNNAGNSNATGDKTNTATTATTTTKQNDSISFKKPLPPPKPSGTGQPSTYVNNNNNNIKSLSMIHEEAISSTITSATTTCTTTAATTSTTKSNNNNREQSSSSSSSKSLTGTKSSTNEKKIRDDTTLTTKQQQRKQNNNNNAATVVNWLQQQTNTTTMANDYYNVTGDGNRNELHSSQSTPGNSRTPTYRRMNRASTHYNNNNGTDFTRGYGQMINGFNDMDVMASPTAFATENTPAMFSHATSLSELTIEDDSDQMFEATFGLVGESSNVKHSNKQTEEEENDDDEQSKHTELQQSPEPEPQSQSQQQHCDESISNNSDQQDKAEEEEEEEAKDNAKDCITMEHGKTLDQNDDDDQDQDEKVEKTPVAVVVKKHHGGKSNAKLTLKKINNKNNKNSNLSNVDSECDSEPPAPPLPAPRNSTHRVGSSTKPPVAPVKNMMAVKNRNTKKSTNVSSSVSETTMPPPPPPPPLPPPAASSSSSSSMLSLNTDTSTVISNQTVISDEHRISKTAAEEDDYDYLFLNACMKFVLPNTSASTMVASSNNKQSSSTNLSNVGGKNSHKTSSGISGGVSGNGQSTNKSSKISKHAKTTITNNNNNNTKSNQITGSSATLPKSLFGHNRKSNDSVGDGKNASHGGTTSKHRHASSSSSTISSNIGGRLGSQSNQMGNKIKSTTHTNTEDLDYDIDDDNDDYDDDSEENVALLEQCLQRALPKVSNKKISSSSSNTSNVNSKRRSHSATTTTKGGHADGGHGSHHHHSSHQHHHHHHHHRRSDSNSSNSGQSHSRPPSANSMLVNTNVVHHHHHQSGAHSNNNIVAKSPKIQYKKNSQPIQYQYQPLQQSLSRTTSNNSATVRQHHEHTKQFNVENTPIQFSQAHSSLSSLFDSGDEDDIGDQQLLEAAMRFDQHCFHKQQTSGGSGTTANPTTTNANKSVNLMERSKQSNNANAKGVNILDGSKVTYNQHYQHSQQMPTPPQQQQQQQSHHYHHHQRSGGSHGGHSSTETNTLGQESSSLHHSLANRTHTRINEQKVPTDVSSSTTTSSSTSTTTITTKHGNNGCGGSDTRNVQHSQQSKQSGTTQYTNSTLPVINNSTNYRGKVPPSMQHSAAGTGTGTVSSATASQNQSKQRHNNKVPGGQRPSAVVKVATAEHKAAAAVAASAAASTSVDSADETEEDDRTYTICTQSSRISSSTTTTSGTLKANSSNSGVKLHHHPSVSSVVPTTTATMTVSPATLSMTASEHSFLMNSGSGGSSVIDLEATDLPSCFDEANSPALMTGSTESYQAAAAAQKLPQVRARSARSASARTKKQSSPANLDTTTTTIPLPQSYDESGSLGHSLILENVKPPSIMASHSLMSQSTASITSELSDIAYDNEPIRLVTDSIDDKQAADANLAVAAAAFSYAKEITQMVESMNKQNQNDHHNNDDDGQNSHNIDNEGEIGEAGDKGDNDVGDQHNNADNECDDDDDDDAQQHNCGLVNQETISLNTSSSFSYSSTTSPSHRVNKTTTTQNRKVKKSSSHTDESSSHGQHQHHAHNDRTYELVDANGNTKAVPSHVHHHNHHHHTASSYTTTTTTSGRSSSNTRTYNKATSDLSNTLVMVGGNMVGAASDAPTIPMGQQQYGDTGDSDTDISENLPSDEVVVSSPPTDGEMVATPRSPQTQTQSQSSFPPLSRSYKLPLVAQAQPKSPPSSQLKKSTNQTMHYSTTTSSSPSPVKKQHQNQYRYSKNRRSRSGSAIGGGDNNKFNSFSSSSSYFSNNAKQHYQSSGGPPVVDDYFSDPEMVKIMPFSSPSSINEVFTTTGGGGGGGFSTGIASGGGAGSSRGTVPYNSYSLTRDHHKMSRRSKQVAAALANSCANQFYQHQNKFELDFSGGGGGSGQSYKFMSTTNHGMTSQQPESPTFVHPGGTTMLTNNAMQPSITNVGMVDCYSLERRSFRSSNNKKVSNNAYMSKDFEDCDLLFTPQQRNMVLATQAQYFQAQGQQLRSASPSVASVTTARQPTSGVGINNTKTSTKHFDRHAPLGTMPAERSSSAAVAAAVSHDKLNRTGSNGSTTSTGGGGYPLSSINTTNNNSNVAIVNAYQSPMVPLPTKMSSSKSSKSKSFFSKLTSSFSSHNIGSSSSSRPMSPTISESVSEHGDLNNLRFDLVNGGGNGSGTGGSSSVVDVQPISPNIGSGSGDDNHSVLTSSSKKSLLDINFKSLFGKHKKSNQFKSPSLPPTPSSPMLNTFSTFVKNSGAGGSNDNEAHLATIGMGKSSSNTNASMRQKVVKPPQVPSSMMAATLSSSSSSSLANNNHQTVDQQDQVCFRSVQNNSSNGNNNPTTNSAASELGGNQAKLSIGQTLSSSVRGSTRKKSSSKQEYQKVQSGSSGGGPCDEDCGNAGDGNGGGSSVMCETKDGRKNKCLVTTV